MAVPAFHRLALGCCSRGQSVWPLQGEEQDLSEGTRAMGMLGEKFLCITPPGNWKMKLLREQNQGTEKAARHSMAGSSQGLSARTSQGLGVMIPETCLQFFCSKGF